MARRRFQSPAPTKRGKSWVLRYWQDEIRNGMRTRRRVHLRLAPSAMPEREVLKIASEHLRPLNQGLESLGSATNFNEYVESTYLATVLPLMARSTQDRYKGIIRNYLSPAFGSLCLRDLTKVSLQRYFTDLATAKELAHASRDKVRDVLASILNSAVEYGLVVKNPVEGLRLARDKRGRRQAMHYVTPEQFDSLLELINEPYATMIYVTLFTGLRVSELAALRWNDVGEHSLTIDERYCRGDWSEPKSRASNARISVNRSVIERIHRLKTLTVEERSGHGAVRRYPAVKSSGPEDLVFQGIRKGCPIRDNNILSHHIKPAGRKLGIPWVNWRCLRTSKATWMIESGANPKDVQAQMRHSRVQTTLDIYAQFVPESQDRAEEQMLKMYEARAAARRARASAAVN